MKMTHRTHIVRVLAAALAIGTALPALAQDDPRWRDRQGQRGDRAESEGEEEREERRRERQERAEQAQGEAARESAARESAAQQEAQRMQVQRAREQQQEQQQQQRQEQERVRAIDRQGANERQQRAIELRNEQMRQAEAHRTEEERQQRYGYGETRDGNRDWNDGDRRRDDDRRGDNDRERDQRYGDNDRRGDRDRDWDRDGDRRGDRDRDWDRDRNDRDRDGRYGHNDRRWDNDSQRRWDNWQRDADRYRRDAWQRHNANRYAALQHQRRMSQYRYQQDYWERQRRWYSGWNTRRYDRNWILSPVVYRYSRGGRWYDINQYAADTLQEAIRIGYAEGARAGDADRLDGWRGGYRDNFVYQDADFGYDGYYVSLSEYQYYFREGFRRGYDDAYGRRYRYGRYSGGDYIIAAATLGLILNLQDY